MAQQFRLVKYYNLPRAMLDLARWGEFLEIPGLVICYIANWKITMLSMGKSTISMAIFNSFVKLPEGRRFRMWLMLAKLVYFTKKSRLDDKCRANSMFFWCKVHGNDVPTTLIWWAPCCFLLLGRLTSWGKINMHFSRVNFVSIWGWNFRSISITLCNCIFGLRFMIKFWWF